MASRDIRRGKRGGYRVIYAISQEARVAYLMYIYPKSKQADISAKEIEALLVDLEEYLLEVEKIAAEADDEPGKQE